MSEEAQESEESVKSVVPAKRGRPKLPIVWSRVLHIKDGEQIKAAEHWVSTDSEIFLKNREKV